MKGFMNVICIIMFLVQEKSREKNKNNEWKELARSRISLGKAVSRAWSTSSRCWIRLNFCEASIAACTKLSYPVLLFLNSAYILPPSHLLYPQQEPARERDREIITIPVAAWTLLERWLMASLSNQLSLYTVFLVSSLTLSAGFELFFSFTPVIFSGGLVSTARTGKRWSLGRRLGRGIDGRLLLFRERNCISMFDIRKTERKKKKDTKFVLIQYFFFTTCRETAGVYINNQVQEWVRVING